MLLMAIDLRIEDRLPGDTRDLLAVLRKHGVAEVDASTRRRAEYGSDASNYRVLPKVVAYPRHTDELHGLVEAARVTGVPLTMRGGGTSVAGNAIGEGIVVDTSRHLTAIRAIDPQARTAIVEPGVILGSLQQAAASYGLRFGPDPSTWARCTIGGMIGNNACGPRALAFGRTADNVLDLVGITGTGARLRASDGVTVIDGLQQLADANLATMRTELGTFGRQISGYSLEHLLPEHGRDLTRALVGTEGTCLVIEEATVKLVPVPRDPTLVVLGYPDMATAADDVAQIASFGAMAIEGLDARIVEVVRAKYGNDAVPPLPTGAGWLLVEVADREPGDALPRARQLADAASTPYAMVHEPGPAARAIWRIREDGVGLAGRTGSGSQAWPGLEDAAVPPKRLGQYLRDFDSLCTRYGIEGIPYGHFGDGCVHVRLDIPLDSNGDVLRSFMTDAADLISGHGGSLSGEHGDGRARGEMLARMYSPEARSLFANFKHLFDPQNILNPGIVVDPDPVDANLRRPAAKSLLASDGFAYAHDDGSFTKAVHRCVGIGKCRADNSDRGGFMCPSYLATGDEKDVTRGRTRVLQEMLNGTVVPDWRSPEVHESLDLCLSCKACGNDCPAGVDMATYKAEVLHRSYKGRIRPITHYSLGWMPRWGRLATRFSGLVNPLVRWRPLQQLVLLLGGMDSRRRIPGFARTPLRRWVKRQMPQRGGRRQIVLWADTFTDNFSDSIGQTAIALLEQAGYDVVVPADKACCGLTWISTGQLDGARRQLSGLVDVLHPYIERGLPILGLEPSCTATVRSDLTELLPGDERARAVAEGMLTLAEVLSSRDPQIGPGDDWVRPDLSGIELVVQPHCHQHSVMGFAPDQVLLQDLGAKLRILAGCCGLAGNFGMERGHYDVSVAVAENALLPALRNASEESVFLADGLSCRTQAEQLAGVRGVHLAELLYAQKRNS